jgi:hypothetical protein
MLLKTALLNIHEECIASPAVAITDENDDQEEQLWQLRVLGCYTEMPLGIVLNSKIGAVVSCHRFVCVRLL